MNPLKNIVDGTKVAMFGYDAIVDKKRRKAPSSRTASEDRVLKNSDKRKANATVRDQRRNYALTAWMVRKHLDYVSDFRFQATTDDPEYNKQLESLMRWWSKARNCDVAQRHSLRSYLRIAEASRVVDGDIGTLLLRGGQIQAIEGDRISNPQNGAIPAEIMSMENQSRLQNGVLANSQGRATNYVINKRILHSDSMEFDKVVRARNLKLLGYFDRFDSVRGVSPLMTAIKSCADIDEVQEYQRIKQKVASLFGTAIKREQTDDDDGFDYESDGDTTSPKYDFELKPGMKLELLPGDSVDLLESKTPGASFIEFQQMSIHIALLALDLPMSMFDSRESSYAAQRQDLLNYQRATKAKQADLIDFLDELTAWKVNTWVRAGLLPDRPTQVGSQSWMWRPCGIPWIDPLKEISAYGMAIANGVLSRREVKNLMGCSDQDWAQTVDELAEEERIAIEKGATLQIAMPGSITTRDEEGAANPANETSQDRANNEQ
jgi:capsid protein